MKKPPLKTLLIFAAIAGAGLFGIIFALVKSNSDTISRNGASGALISEILLGSRAGVNPADPDNPRIKQKNVFVAGEPIMLRVTTTKTVSAPYTISVRLRDNKQVIHPLTPELITLQPGKSTFCCWTVAEPGDYILHLLLPNGPTTTIPIEITRAPTINTSTLKNP